MSVAHHDAMSVEPGEGSAAGPLAAVPLAAGPLAAVPPATKTRRRNASTATGNGCGDRSSLMHVGRRVDYAVRALAYLAGQEPARVVGRGEIETRQGIPRHFLAKILRRLVAAGLLESVPGARGGFRLHVPADEITVRRVYECLEGELCLVDCMRDHGSSCCFVPVCTQVDVWRGAQRRLLEYLGGISIASLADRRGLAPRLDARSRTRAAAG